jgi:hypothetical protein
MVTSSIRSSGLVLLAAIFLSACGSRTALELASDATGPADSGLPALTTHLGAITLMSGGNGAYAYASAQFFPPTNELPATCGGTAGSAAIRLAATGGCGLVHYSLCQGQLSLNAGTIRVSTPSFASALAYVGDSPRGDYPNSVIVPRPQGLSAGSIVDFQGQGGPDVPPFKVSVTVPAFGRLITPADTLDAPPTIDTTTDLNVTWEPIPVGEAVFAIAVEALDTLYCYFDGASGSGVVPQSALATLKALSPSGSAGVAFVAMARGQGVAGTWTIEALAFNSGPESEEFPVVLQ